jgi:uncharacterized protein (TIGR02231 family)
MKRSKKRASGIGGGGDAMEDEMIGGAAAGFLPPRLRYSYLRLRAPGAPYEGQLKALDALTHLEELVADHGVDAVSALHDAVNALKQARRRLLDAAPPTGSEALEAGHFPHVFKAEGKHSIPSDGEGHRVVAAIFTGAPKLRYEAVPRQADDVYQTCLFPLAEDTPLSPGPLQVFDEGVFKVKTNFSTTPGASDLRINLGIEPRIKITSRHANIHQEEKGLMGGTSQIRHSVTVKVRSTLGNAAHLTLHDRIPIPADNQKDLKVNLVESDPKPQQDEKGPRGGRMEGAAHWKLEVPPGEESTVTYTYTIELPAKAELVGGNRRE